MDQLYRREFLIRACLTLGDSSINAIGLSTERIIALSLGILKITNKDMDKIYMALGLIE